MNGLIVSPEYSGTIHRAMETILFEQVGHFSGEEFVTACNAAANVKLDVLVIDLTCCTDSTAIVNGLRKYRIARSARVIVFAPNRVPGDATLSALVAEGIYDFVAPQLAVDEAEEEEVDEELEIVQPLKRQIQSSYHMGNAARWRFIQEPTENNESEKVKGKVAKAAKPDTVTVIERIETVVYQDRIIGAVSIGVFGATTRTGSTFTALQMALWLSRKHRTALVEMNATSVRDLGPEEWRTGKNQLKIEQLHVYTGEDSITATDLLLKEWDYVVFDFGSYWRDHLHLFARCQLHVMTAMGGDNRQVSETLHELLRREWSRPLHLRVLSSDGLYKEWTESLSKQERREMKLHFWQAHLTDSPLLDDPSSPWGAMLQDVLPRKQKKLGIFSLFGKGGRT